MKASLTALVVSSLLLFQLHPSSAAPLGKTCVMDRNCDEGLHCEKCLADGNLRPRCTRIKPTDPKSKGGRDLPFNRYAWLTTHNSFAKFGTRTLAPTNQQDSVTDQLNNGVRGLMLDMYDFLNDIWLCHSFGGNCYNITAFQPAINVLEEIQAFLEAKPSEVITIFIEDYVTSPKGLTKVFTNSGLMKYWFPVSRMPQNGRNWPLLGDMIDKNQRLVVFTSKSWKEASEGIAYEWRYVVENQYGDGGMKDGSCPNRAESSPMNTTSRSLVLMNYFPDAPNLPAACKENSGPLESMLYTCHNASANRWPNFITVDFYKRSNGGGAPEATDIANGKLICGCDSVTQCKVNGSWGQCQDSPKAAPASTGLGPQKTSNTSTVGRSLLKWWWIIMVSMAIALLPS